MKWGCGGSVQGNDVGVTVFIPAVTLLRSRRPPPSSEQAGVAAIAALGLFVGLISRT